ncbi:MAG: filamentous hemagglutinin N-terminal domain-containing protein, partial [Betaproteobacteria bacterium]|nr:filamentous hemagglutinin N-terminal domain-containing protein [Betaproteobacteria bacterium]
QATFAAQGNVLTVTNTPGSVINWQSFSIASQEITRFLQQSAASAVLNRVISANPSAILGALQSNGRVFLINPNGISIGPGAKIDVNGFLASTLNLSDADFLAGRYRFSETPGAGNVVNQGTITTPAGGTVYLIGQNVENHGVIKTPQGEIILAAGRSVELVDASTPEVRVQITAPDNQALNLGQLIATGGRIGMYAGLVRHGGTANANTAVVGENGKIVFKATKDVRLEAGSVTTASGPTAGSIKVEAQTGTATVAGTVEANATAGRGGNIEVTGQQGVTVEPTGRVSASGVEGGTVALSSPAGAVRVAGNVSADASAGRGGQVAVAAATQASVAAGARVTASGTLGGGSASVTGNTGVTLEAGSSVQANGAGGGTVAISAEQGPVEISGAVEATGTGAGGGAITATGSDVTLNDASVLSVRGSTGGTVYIEARRDNPAGTTLASGLIDASGNDGPGGKVLLLGPRVGLVRNSVVNASGTAGGGLVLVGGDFQGGNPDIPNAERTYVGPDARITADAIETGDGGKVIVWADDWTKYYGFISAKGGAQSGDGGFAEVSGKGTLFFDGRVDLLAPHGKAGTLLLDPTDIFIATNQASATAAGMTTTDTSIDGDTTSPLEATGAVQDSLLTTASLLSVLNGGDVIVSTANAAGTSTTGDIHVVDDISYTNAATRLLTLRADNTINFRANANLTSSTGVLNVVLHADADNSGAGAIVMNSGSSIVSNGGNIVMGGGSNPLTGAARGTATNQDGVSILGATVSSGA